MSHRSARPRRGIALGLLGSLFAAFFLVPFRFAADAPPGAFVVLILALSGLFNGVYASLHPRSSLRISRKHHGVAAALAALSVFGNFCVAEGTKVLDIGLASVFLHTQIFFVALLAFLFLNERLTGRLAVGGLLAFGAIGLMQLVGRQAAVSLPGTLWALGASLSFASMLVLTRGFIRDIDIIGLNAIRLAYATVMAAALPGVAERLPELTSFHWICAAAAALCGPFISRLAQMHALEHLTAAHLKLITMATPVLAIGADFAFFGTVPSALQLLCSLAVLGGVLLPALEMWSRTSQPPREP